jgi:Fe(3+) dicitrate transport protein
MKRDIIKFAVIVALFTFTIQYSSQAQSKSILSDSANPTYLPNLNVVGKNSKSDIQQLPEIVGTNINAGKKNSLIVMDNVNGNVVTNTMRQVMAKVPGIQIWESDGSGIQIGIAARGLSPNRSWEFNVRQNGYDISADPFGYPEAYYNPQLQAVQRIEVIRGQGSLQYGPQFGGMVNYLLRNGSDIKKPFQFETQQTIGSNGLFNSYNAVGGTYKKINYYAFLDHRNAEGWRQNSQYATNNGYGTITFKINNKLSLTAELMHATQRSQQPGGLTDVQFNQNAQQSFRSRNWFDIKWTTAALIANYEINATSRLNVKLFTVAGDRSSVGFLKSILIQDTINATSLQYNNRTLDIDTYRNLGFETRYIKDYKISKIAASLSAGVRLYTGTTHRLKDGVANNSAAYTNQLISGAKWPKDINYQSFNAAAFVENLFRFNKLLIIPGIRIETVKGKASGITGYTNTGLPIELQAEQRNRNFLLAGIGVEYHLTKKTELYGNITQAYRPIQFSDLTAPPTTDVIDQNISDAKGYNIDAGYRGKVKNYLFFDVSAFLLQYNNRIGTVTQQRTDGSFYNYRTNVGNSTSTGIEALAEISLVKAFSKKAKKFDVTTFASFSYTYAKYNSLKVIVRDGTQLKETNLADKKVENAPENIVRTGISFMFQGLTITTQLSYVDKAFTDANNTVVPTENGQIGLIPAYTVADFTANYKFKEKFNIKFGVNNLTNASYFTRRSGGYPGPGILPADGRTMFFSIGANF